jgi:hypothetical protein
MGSSRERDRTNQMLDRGYDASRSGYNQFISGQQNQLGGARERDLALRNDIMSRYQGMANQPAFGFDASGNYTGPRVGGANRGDFAKAIGSYNNFIDTGGLTDQDVNALRLRGTSVIPSFYEGLQNDMSRRRNIQGGYSPGYDAQASRLARDASRGALEASYGAEADIVGKRLQGKQFGTSGAAEVAARIGAMNQAASQANAELQARLGAQGNEDRLRAVGGLAQLYGTAPGESGQAAQQLLQGMGGRDQASQGYLGLRYGANPATTWQDSLNSIGNLAGGVGGLMTGFGSFGSPDFGQTPGLDSNRFLQNMPQFNPTFQSPAFNPGTGAMPGMPAFGGGGMGGFNIPPQDVRFPRYGYGMGF